VIFVNLLCMRIVNLWSLWTCELVIFENLSTCELWTCDLYELVNCEPVIFGNLPTCGLWTCDFYELVNCELVLFLTCDNCDLVILWTRYIERFSYRHVYRSYFKFRPLLVYFLYINVVFDVLKYWFCFPFRS
jgi:hypothetical protein